MLIPLIILLMLLLLSLLLLLLLLNPISSKIHARTFDPADSLDSTHHGSPESSSSVLKLINHYVIGLTNEGKGGL